MALPLSCLTALLLACSQHVNAQQVYVPGSNDALQPQCNASQVLQHPKTSPTYYFSRFSYTQTETVRTASPVVSTKHTPYASGYSALSHLVPGVSTTSWGNWNPSATAKASDQDEPYGQAAWSALWNDLNVVNFTRGIYSQTVSPTPIPTSELIYPPPRLFNPQTCYTFPEDFMLGVAASAAQVEGAIADEGRGPAIPDTALWSGVFDFVTAGLPTQPDYVAVENYYLYKQDITRLAAMGVRYYSFSIPWSRILPFALPGTPINSQGLAHYDDLINFIIEKGMQPVVTLHHFDTPLQLLGPNATASIQERIYYGVFDAGFQNETWVDSFVHYGKIVMTHFADRVPIWITINEPQAGATNGQAVYNVLESHAQLWHFYHDTLNGTGKVTLKSDATPGLPQDPHNASHVAAAKWYTDYAVSTLLNPLALGEDYPEAYKATIQDYVPLNSSKLAYFNGTLDFVAVDAYSTTIVYPLATPLETCARDNSTNNTHYPSCVGTTDQNVYGWNVGFNEDYFTYTMPTYLRTTLNEIWNTWKHPVVITEFGFSENVDEHPNTGDISFDTSRSDYYISYYNEILKAIWEDGVHVMGTFTWSWIDNWELGTFDHQFGLQSVNRTTMERKYKRSFFDIIDFVVNRKA